MPHNSPVCGHIFRFDGAFLRSKTGLFCALEKVNSLLFNRSLASFRLFNIFFESSVYFPRRPGQFSNLFRAFCDGVLHRSTSLAYHDSRLVSRAKMQGKKAGPKCRSKESEGWQKAATVRASPAKATPTSQAPAPFHSPPPSTQPPSPQTLSSDS